MSSRWTAQWGQAVSYNCMSVLQTHRRRDICKFYGQSAVICLQGTRVRQDRDIPLKSFLESNFYCISFGYSSRSNKHAGVDIMLSNKFFKQEDIRMISWPEEPELAGRALHVRTADATRDHSWICAYIPPNSISLAKKVYGWLRKLYRSIAGRTFAVLCIDANGHVGLGQSSASIGAESPEKEDALGGLFKLFLEDFGLCALNTFHECVPSFHSGRDNCRGTRPDYIVIPFTRFVNEGYLARTVCVDQTGGDALQLVRTVKRVDHSPVVAKVLLKSLQYSGGAFSMNAKFDLHKLSRCLLLGENRQVFPTLPKIFLNPSKTLGMNIECEFLPPHFFMYTQLPFSKLQAFSNLASRSSTLSTRSESTTSLSKEDNYGKTSTFRNLISLRWLLMSHMYFADTVSCRTTSFSLPLDKLSSNGWSQQNSRNSAKHCKA